MRFSLPSFLSKNSSVIGNGEYFSVNCAVFVTAHFTLHQPTGFFLLFQLDLPIPTFCSHDLRWTHEWEMREKRKLNFIVIILLHGCCIPTSFVIILLLISAHFLSGIYFRFLARNFVKTMNSLFFVHNSFA